jgi:hypothetical protein
MRLERNAETGSVAALCVVLTVGLLTGAEGAVLVARALQRIGRTAPSVAERARR